MSLKEYNKKRNFSKNKELRGKIKKSKKENIYSIQEHHAKKLHWDLRLEKDGVLKSWAITKEPSKNPKIKRLAVQTEDHPIDYAFFEGVIPEGNYGAGKIKIYDKGAYEMIEYTSNKKIIFDVKGKKLKGVYCLIKFGKEKKNWLFFKKKT